MRRESGLTPERLALVCLYCLPHRLWWWEQCKGFLTANQVRAHMGLGPL